MSALIPSSTPSSTTLIPTTTGTLAGVEQTLVDARTLHKHLGVGKMFAHWIKDRIETYGFSEGSDFLPKLAKTPGLFGGRPKTEYLLSLEVAKELALIENNAAGRAIRRALIAYERDTPALLRRQQAQIAQLRLALVGTDRVLHDLVRYHQMGLARGEIAKLLGISGDAVARRLRKADALGLLHYRPNPRLAAAGRKGALSARALAALGV